MTSVQGTGRRTALPIRTAAIWAALLAACGSAATTSAGQRVGVAVMPAVATVPPGGRQLFAAVVTGGQAPVVDWSVSQGSTGGTIAADGTYTAPSGPGTYQVVATERSSRVSGQATVTVQAGCWQLAAVNRVRFQPAPGQAAAMAGGTIQGSNDSATNGFVVLATIATAPADGQWTELAFANATPYRWVKYYAPATTAGLVAELEFYAGTTRVTGPSFGTTGTTGHAPAQALDGDVATYYEGTQTISNYLGIDLSADHLAATPTFTPAGGTYATAQLVTISTSTPGAAIRYTTDGSAPAGGAIYTGPIRVGNGVTTLSAIASASCLAPSAPASATYDVATSVALQAFIAIGNSLTDTLDGYMAPIASSGGVPLDWSRYTSPGIGTWIYEEYPTGGFGVANVQTSLTTKPFQHVSFQPFPNLPCVPTGYANEALPRNRSDAVNIDHAWSDAVGPNPGVQMWVYEAWPPTPTEGFRTCITGGQWNRDPAIWNPTSPATWEEAEAHQLQYNEAVRAGLIALHPGRPVPYIVPAGRALRNLKAAVEAGAVPGIGPSAFWTTFFTNGGTDNHLTPIGRYVATLAFYACLFQADPRLLPDTNLGTPATVTAAQAAALQQIVYDTVSGYALSGYTR